MKTTVKGMNELMRAIKIIRAIDLPKIWTIRLCTQSGKIEKLDDYLDLLTCANMMGKGILLETVTIDIEYDDYDPSIPEVHIEVKFEYAI